jgi:hypothetical protein
MIMIVNSFESTLNDNGGCYLSMPESREFEYNLNTNDVMLTRSLSCNQSRLIVVDDSRLFHQLSDCLHRLSSAHFNK